MKKIEKKVQELDRWYKGYDIEWLRKEFDHVDFYLVAEYDKLKSKKGGEK